MQRQSWCFAQERYKEKGSFLSDVYCGAVKEGLQKLAALP